MLHNAMLKNVMFHNGTLQNGVWQKSVQRYKTIYSRKIVQVSKWYMLENGTLQNGSVPKRYITERYTDIIVCYICL
jgi:hypothetical protein